MISFMHYTDQLIEGHQILDLERVIEFVPSWLKVGGYMHAALSNVYTTVGKPTSRCST